jgi:hypothetical protein
LFKCINVHAFDVTYGIELKMLFLLKLRGNIHTTIGSLPSVGARGASISSIISIIAGGMVMLGIVFGIVLKYILWLYFNFVFGKLIL